MRQDTDPSQGNPEQRKRIDAYFSADVETDGPIPGPYSMLSFALVYAGCYDGRKFKRPETYSNIYYTELSPISENYEQEALSVNRLDRNKLIASGKHPRDAMEEAATWVKEVSAGRSPVLVAYPLSFDWTWLYWFFVAFTKSVSPFSYSRCFDIKTAVSLKSGQPISVSARSRLPPKVASHRGHTHHAVDDAVEQAEIFANVFEWNRHDQNR
jgi:hypothetical protein